MTGATGAVPPTSAPEVVPEPAASRDDAEHGSRSQSRDDHESREALDHD